jgi:cytochrome c-type biogenesis protein CcmH/NrfF
MGAGHRAADGLDCVVARSGEFVLSPPPFPPANAALWLSGPVFLLRGGGLALASIRHRARAPGPARPPLTEDERRRLEALTGE